MRASMTNEQEFVLNDLAVYREFDMNNFVSNAKLAIFETPAKFSNMNAKLTTYRLFVQNTYAHFKELKVDNDILLTFNNLDKKYFDNIDYMADDLIDDDVVDIKPDYLNQYIKNIGIIIDKILNKKNTEDDIEKILSVTEKVKKQCVRTSLSYLATSKDLMKSRTVEKVKFTNQYMNTKLLPYINNIDKKVKQIDTMTTNVIITLNKANINIDTYIKTINTLSLENETQKILRHFLYNAIRGVIDISSFISYCLIRKIGIFTDNITNINKLSTVLNSYNSVTTENGVVNIITPTDSNSLGEELVNGKIDSFTILANNIYDFNSSVMRTNSDTPLTILGVDDENPINIEVVDDSQKSYDNDIYTEIREIFKCIAEGLDRIASYTDEYYLVAADIIDRSGLNTDIKNKYLGRINMIDDITEYSSNVGVTVDGSNNETIYSRMLAEVKDYSHNMELIAKDINDDKIRINILKESLTKSFDGPVINDEMHTVNNEYENSQAIQELKIFLDNFDDQYNEMIVVIADKFMNRLQNIGLLLNTLNAKRENQTNEVEVNESLYDFVESAYDSIISDYEEITDKIFESMVQEYTTARQRKERGVNIIFTEADNTNSVVVNNNAGQQTSPTTTQATSTTVTNTNKSGGFVKTFVDQINKWFTGIQNRLQNLINSQNAKRDAVYFTNHKQELLGMDLSNSSATMLDYDNLLPSANILTDTKNLITKVSNSNLTPQKLNAATDDTALNNLVFGNTPPASVWTSNNPAEAITEYYKKGNNTKAEPKTLSGNDLRALVNNAINYCEPFYSKTLPEIQKNIKASTDNLSQIATTVVKESFIDSIFGDIYTEAENDNNQKSSVVVNNGNKNNDGNSNKLSDKMKKIDKNVRIYTGAVLTAAFSRYNDYMKLLKGLVPDTNNTTK